MLDRYKKKGGFTQLLQLIETSPVRKQEQFLALIAEESPVWEEQLRKRVLTIEKIFGWDAQTLSEILTRLQPLTLAACLHGSDAAHIERILSVLPPITKRKINDMINDTNPNQAEKATCMMKIITEVRGFVAQGYVKLEKVDPELIIPENYEDVLATMLTSNQNTEDSPVSLNFDGFSRIDQNKGPLTHDSNNQAGDVEFLRRKINHLNSEINALKHENSVLKDKLAQIKRIA